MTELPPQALPDEVNANVFLGGLTGSLTGSLRPCSKSGINDFEEREEMHKSATAPPVYNGPVLPPEDQHKVIQSNYYRINPLSHHLGHPLHPAFKECNLRVDFGVDGGIYKVEWTNVPVKEGK